MSGAYMYVGGCRRQVAGGREESEMSVQVGGADYGICDYCAKWSHGLLSNDRYSGCCPECRVELNRDIATICQWCGEHTQHDVLYADPRGFCNNQCKYESEEI